MTISPILSELDSLQATLNASLDAIRSELFAQRLPELSSSGDQPHPLDDPTIVVTPRYYEARRTATATLGLIKSLIQSPFEKVTEANFAHYEQAGLEIVARLRLVECLADSPSRKGLHVNKLQTILDVDAAKLTTLLRMLATRGWFVETSEGTFANARPVLQLLAGSSGWKSTRSPRKAHIANALVDTMTVSDWKYSQSPVETAFQLANDTHMSIYEYLQVHPRELEIFGESMEALNEALSPGIIRDFNWQALSGKTIVDCGGGAGTLAVALSQAFPKVDLRFVVQDLPEVVDQGKLYVDRFHPGARESGRITLEAHDFFTSQVRKADGDTVYMIRWVLHNWADDNATKILKQLADAARKNKNKILIIESISLPGIPQDAPSTSTSTSAQTSLDALAGQSEYATIPAPPYVPANFGESAKLATVLGLHVMSILNANPRVLRDWEALLCRAGLRIGRIYPLRSFLSVIEAEVVE